MELILAGVPAMLGEISERITPMNNIASFIALCATLLAASPALAQVTACTADEQCGDGEFCAKSDYTDPTTEGACLAKTNPVAPSILNKKALTEAGVPVNAARGGIITGGVIDLVGFTLFMVGGAVSSRNLGVGLNLAYSGGGLLTVGSVVSSVSYTARHKAYRDAGYGVTTGRRAGSWVLTGLTLACYGGSLGVGMASDGSLGLALTSIGLNGAAAIFEMVNLLTVRPKWDAALRAGAAKKPSASVYPLFQAGRNPALGSSWVLGVGVGF